MLIRRGLYVVVVAAGTFKVWPAHYTARECCDVVSFEMPYDEATSELARLEQEMN